jgi:hypothetical protein
VTERSVTGRLVPAPVPVAEGPADGPVPGMPAEEISRERDGNA